jgi:hypothetical protein
MNVIYTRCIVCDVHTYCQIFLPGKSHTFKYNVVAMRKDTALSFRIPGHLKTELEKVALSEGRSLAQVCEALLAGGLEIYKKEGPKYFQRLLSRQKKEHPE